MPYPLQSLQRLQYNQVSVTITESVRFEAISLRQTYQSFADHMTSMALKENASWPFVTLPDMNIHGARLGIVHLLRHAFVHFDQGVELTLKSFLDVLKRANVEPVDPESEPFDPQLHEAISMVKNPEVEPNTVLNVVQKGYTLNGRLVRPAMVMVSKG